MRIFCLPVKCIDIPLDHRLINIFIDSIIDTAAGRAHDFRCKADQILKKFIILAHCRDDLVSCDKRQNFMLIRMRSDLHAERVFTFELIPIIIRLNSHDEECRLGVVLFKDIENPSRVLRRSVIICQSHKLLLGSRIKDTARIKESVRIITGVHPAGRKITVIHKIISLTFDCLPAAHILCVIRIFVPPSVVIDIPAVLPGRRIGYSLPDSRIP